MRYSSLILVLVTLSRLAVAEPISPWHQYAVTIHAGAVQSPVSLDNKGPYTGRDLNTETEYGVSVMSSLSDRMALVLGLSDLKTGGNLASSDNTRPWDLLNMNIRISSLWLTWRFHPGETRSLLRPWLGAGLHTGLLKERYNESFYVAGSGFYGEDPVERTSLLWGAHLSVGVNIYPSRNSSVCLVIQDRYHLSFTSGSFEGDIRSNTFIAGIRWDWSLIPD